MAASVYRWLTVSLIGLFFFICAFALRSAAKSPLGGAGGPHPFHVSTTEINHNATDKTLEISCRLFTNDFETILEKNYKVKVDLTHPQDKAAMDKIVSDYIKKHLQLKADNKATSLSYLGFEIDNDAVYAYLQVDNVASVKKIEVVDSLMYDLFEDQVGIIHMIVGGNRKSTKLDYPDTQASFSF